MFHVKNDPKWTFVRWDSFHNCLKNLVDIGSQFCWNLKKDEGRKIYRETSEQHRETKKQLANAPTHPNALFSWDIKHPFNLCLYSLWISVFQVDLRETWEIRENNLKTQQQHVGPGVPCWWWGWLPAELQKPGRSWPPSVLEPPSQDHKRLLTSSMSIHNNDNNDNNKSQLGARNQLLYLIGINNQKDALACRNWSRYFITEVNMTLKIKAERGRVVQHVIKGHKNCGPADVYINNQGLFDKGSHSLRSYVYFVFSYGGKKVGSIKSAKVTAMNDWSLKNLQAHSGSDWHLT